MAVNWDNRLLFNNFKEGAVKIFLNQFYSFQLISVQFQSLNSKIVILLHRVSIMVTPQTNVAVIYSLDLSCHDE
jgi:hypothetical protein